MTEPESDVLAARYGRTRTQPHARSPAADRRSDAFAIVLVAWVVWAGLDGQKP